MMNVTSVMSNTAGLDSVAGMFGISFTLLLIIMVAIVLLQGLAMYKAARLQEKVAFWTLLIFNTLGIYPAIYLYIKRNQKVK